jgi:hypothetical protein
MHHLAVLGTIALLLSPVVAWSQEPLAIVPGSRIRITEAGSSKPRSGTVVTAGRDTVVLRLDKGGETATFSLARISGLEVSGGRKGHVAAGVGLGFLAGVGIGALLGAVFAPESASNSEEGTYPYVGIGAVIGAGAGMLLGGVVGGAHKSDRWEAVPSSRWQLSTLPTGPGGFSLALSVRF